MPKQVVIHPLLFAVYPAVFLYNGNKIVFDFSIAFAPAAVTATIAAILWLALAKLLSDWRRGAVVTSALLMSFFSFGVVEEFFQSSGGPGSNSSTWAVIVVCMLAKLISLRTDCEGYIDPGAGSYILQVAVASLLGVAFAVKSTWGNLKASLRDKFAKRK